MLVVDSFDGTVFPDGCYYTVGGLARLAGVSEKAIKAYVRRYPDFHDDVYFLDDGRFYLIDSFFADFILRRIGKRGRPVCK